MAVGVDVEMSELKRGMVGSSVDDSPAQERLSLLFTALAAPTRCSSFVAQVIVLSDPRAGAIHAGSELTVLCRSEFDRAEAARRSRGASAMRSGGALVSNRPSHRPAPLWVIIAFSLMLSACNQHYIIGLIQYQFSIYIYMHILYTLYI